MNKAEKLLQAENNIFTIQDLGVLWQIFDRKKLLENIKYYLRNGRLHQIQRGVYAKNKNYDLLQLAQKIIPLSYISFYTALAHHGIIFQYHKTIHSMALKSRKIEADHHIFAYHRIKPEIFFHPLGIEKKSNYLIASKERAICDSLYLSPSLAFDHLEQIEVQKLLTVSKIYNNQRLEKEIIHLTKTIHA